MYTVVSRQTTPDQRRALIATVLTLGLTTALAATLVQAKRTGFPVSFQPPTDWSEFKRRRAYVEFRDTRDSANSKQLIIHVIAWPPGMSATELALLVMNSHLSHFPTVGSLAAADEVPLGTLPGARVDMPDAGHSVHVGLLLGDEREAVVLRYHTDRPFTERDIRTYRQVVDSVTPTEAP